MKPGFFLLLIVCCLSFDSVELFRNRGYKSHFSRPGSQAHACFLLVGQVKKKLTQDSTWVGVGKLVKRGGSEEVYEGGTLKCMGRGPSYVAGWGSLRYFTTRILTPNNPFVIGNIPTWMNTEL